MVNRGDVISAVIRSPETGPGTGSGSTAFPPIFLPETMNKHWGVYIGGNQIITMKEGKVVRESLSDERWQGYKIHSSEDDDFADVAVQIYMENRVSNDSLTLKSIIEDKDANPQSKRFKVFKVLFWGLDPRGKPLWEKKY